MINEYDLATEISKNNELDKAMVADIISSVLNTLNKYESSEILELLNRKKEFGSHESCGYAYAATGREGDSV
jgi:predicted DNA-binding protein YlxM (UPF0122 family)